MLSIPFNIEFKTYLHLEVDVGGVESHQALVALDLVVFET